jgi:hypothetical protein
MKPSSPRTSWLAASAAAVFAPAWVAAQGDEEGAFDRTPQDCLILQLVDDTDVIDDQTILFRLRNDKVYRNTLPRKCPGLEREGRFMYETRSGRLCSIDTITVLELFGVGPTRGFTCRLGEFVPLSPAEVEELDAQEREEGRGRARRGIEARPVEVEPAEPAADAEPAAGAQPPEADE